MNIKEIEQEINKLEKGPNNFDTCLKLASLYIVKDNLEDKSKTPIEDTTIEKTVEKEFKDILPQYKKYCSIKKQYQLNLISSEAVDSSIQLLCQEIKEFIEAIYFNTNTESEKEIMNNMLQKLAAL